MAAQRAKAARAFLRGVSFCASGRDEDEVPALIGASGEAADPALADPAIPLIWRRRGLRWRGGV